MQRHHYNSRGELVNSDLAADWEELLRLELINSQSEAEDIKGNFTIKKQNWSYDPIGNREQAETEYNLKSPQGLENSSLSYEANSVNQYNKDEYDQSGNQTLLQTGGYTWHVLYNAENRPVLFHREPNAAEDQEVSLIMKYDSRGRRTVKTAFVDGIMTDSRKFVYDDFLLVAELRSQNTDESEYALHQTFLWDHAETAATRPLCMTCWQNGSHEEGANASPDYSLERFNINHVDVPFWEDESLAGRYFYIQGHNKNIKGVTNHMSELMGEYDYSPFGEVVTSSLNDITSSNPFRFSSEYYDRELGLYYYNYRHYNPQDGRWLSRDLIEEKGGYNLYGFVNNNPVNFYDSKGLDYWMENTKSALGFHRRICVDVWAGPTPIRFPEMADKDVCCLGPELWYRRYYKYCISFAEFSVSYPGKTGHLPSGMEPSSLGGDGAVYIDGRPAISEDSRLKTTCRQDMKIHKYLAGMVGTKADYSVFSQNCRDFSQFAHDEITNDIGMEVLAELIKNLFGYITRRCS